MSDLALLAGGALADGRYRMTVTAAARGAVSGRLERIGARGAGEPVGLGTLVDFAAFLALEGCRALKAGDADVAILQVSANNITASSAPYWTGECRLHAARSGLCVAEVAISDEASGRIALITETVSVGGGEPAAAAALARAMPAADAADAELALPPGRERGAIPALRRRQIFEAATRVITDKGFERATMREIAREAGLTIPTMYQYVRAKDGLLELIFDTYLTKMEEGLRRAVASRTTATERLTAAVSATLANLSVYYREIRIMTYDTKSLRPEILDAVLRRMMKYLSIFTEIVSEGVASGEFRPVNAELYANLIPMMCQIWVQRYWSVGKFGLPTVERAILDLALDGLRSTGARG
ncbi:MAG TPA: TetR/AcrR family transcriptional regulator [Stellaceae bacterium]|nr:TetR/AcrR family transcriptional regulator [Stellaceae bacterium]